jgi:hypothetical protein
MLWMVTFFLWFASCAEYMGSVLNKVFKSFLYFNRSRIRYGDRLWAGWPGFNSRQGKEVHLCYTASIPALGPIQFPIHLVPWVPSLGVKQVRRVDDHSSQSSAEVKNEGAKPPLHIRLHGVVLNYLSKGTTLLLTLSLVEVIFGYCY